MSSLDYIHKLVISFWTRKMSNELEILTNVWSSDLTNIVLYYSQASLWDEKALDDYAKIELLLFAKNLRLVYVWVFLCFYVFMYERFMVLRISDHFLVNFTQIYCHFTS